MALSLPCAECIDCVQHCLRANGNQNWVDSWTCTALLPGPVQAAFLSTWSAIISYKGRTSTAECCRQPTAGLHPRSLPPTPPLVLTRVHWYCLQHRDFRDGHTDDWPPGHHGLCCPGAGPLRGERRVEWSGATRPGQGTGPAVSSRARPRAAGATSIIMMPA